MRGSFWAPRTVFAKTLLNFKCSGSVFFRVKVEKGVGFKEREDKSEKGGGILRAEAKNGGKKDLHLDSKRACEPLN